MRQKLVDENDHVLSELNPELLRNYKILKKDTKKHRQDNDAKYQELLKLKKGNSQLQQMINNEVQIVTSLQQMLIGQKRGLEDD
mmetsp:Transcript_22087/g.25389  ORF Transcript_22087/g.25389 Transcript_22087/m.25389 type:complete len:84 (-) Transcript_22087:72-323(-)